MQWNTACPQGEWDEPIHSSMDGPDSVTVSEVRHRQIWHHPWEIHKQQHEGTCTQNRDKLTGLGNKPVITKGRRDKGQQCIRSAGE